MAEPRCEPAPSEASVESVTILLKQAGDGRADAWSRIYSILYQEMYRIARSQLRQHRPGSSHSPTSLISKGWIKLANVTRTAENREHLVALMARAMRYVVIDEARSQMAAKRGRGIEPLTLDPNEEPASQTSAEDLILLSQLLEHLAEIDTRMATVVELRHFAGMTDKEIGALLKIHERTARQIWERARSFLVVHMKSAR